MTLAKYKPVFGVSHGYRDFLSEMNDLFTNFFGENQMQPQHSVFTPQIDVSETDDAIQVQVEVPGIKKEDVQITLYDDVLTIKGEKKFKNEEKGKSYHRIETSSGAFERTLNMPSYVDRKSIKAQYKDGVLTIDLKKAEEAKPKEIEISIA